MWYLNFKKKSKIVTVKMECSCILYIVCLQVILIKKKCVILTWNVYLYFVYNLIFFFVNIFSTKCFVFCQAPNALLQFLFFRMKDIFFDIASFYRNTSRDSQRNSLKIVFYSSWFGSMWHFFIWQINLSLLIDNEG